jgi:hypothetical protein
MDMATLIRGIPASGDAYIDSLLGGAKWNPDPSTGQVTFSFPDSRSDYEPDYEQRYLAETGHQISLNFDESFHQVTPEQMEATRAILTGTTADPSASGVLRTTAVSQFTELSLADAGFDNADIRSAQNDRQNGHITFTSHTPGPIDEGVSWERCILHNLANCKFMLV